MNSYLPLVSLLVLSSGCAGRVDTQTGPAKPFVEGTRVVAHALYFDGAPPLLLAPHDLKTDQDCSFQQVDGKTLCVSPNQTVPAPTATEAPASTAGTLTLVQDVTEDGGTFPSMRGTTSADVFDTQWKLACEVNYQPESGDGECMPPVATVMGFFADSGCTAPVATSFGDTTPVLVQQGTSYFAVGAESTGPIFSGGPSSCAAFTPMGSGFRHFSIGAAIADPRIAAVHISYVGTGRLSIATLEDNQRVVGYGRIGVASESLYRDSELGKDCQPIRTPEGVRCYSGKLVSKSDLFGDDQCTLFALPNPGDVDTVAIETITNAIDGLSQATDIYRIDTSAGAAKSLFKIDNGHCVAAGPMKQDLYTVAGPGDWARFAKLEERIGSRVVSP